MGYVAHIGGGNVYVEFWLENLCRDHWQVGG